MKIIFSPAKDMDFSRKIYDKDLIISKKTENILKEIRSLDKESLKKTLKLSDNLLDDVFNYYKNFYEKPFYRAIDLYNGLSFRQLDKNFSKSEEDYIKNNLIILSSLYGMINGLEIISPYRLDMNTKLKVDNLNLKKYWLENYNKININETIFNLASDEFSSLINRKNYEFIDFSFYKIKDNKLKSHSTTAKKGRGIILNNLIKNEINNLDELLELEINALIYRKDLSSKNNIVYILND